MSTHHHIDLIEFSTGSKEEVAATKDFFTTAFGWKYKDWSDIYSDTQDSGIASGVTASESGKPSMPLAVIYSENLEETKDRIVRAGGTIILDTYPFPGGRRFHFTDPSGNELAVWSA